MYADLSSNFPLYETVLMKSQHKFTAILVCFFWTDKSQCRETKGRGRWDVWDDNELPIQDILK
jgi:hypothetical protein